MSTKFERSSARTFAFGPELPAGTYLKLLTASLTFWSVLSISSTVAIAGPCKTPGCLQVARASTTMEQGVEKCAANLQGKAFIDCVASEMSKYSTRLGQKGAEIVAPQGAPTAAEAAAGVKASPTPAAAASVLNRVASVVAGLSTTGEASTRMSYNRINQAFSRAATVLGSKS